MDTPNNAEFDRMVGAVEFPGEQPELIFKYLDGHLFVDKVMERIQLEAERSQKAFAWALFALLNLALLVLIGTNRYVLISYFSLQETLAQLFFLFLGLSFLGALFGLIVTINTSWVESLPGLLQPLLAPVRQIGRYVHRR
ncbi:MAG TPA: hypothetical protein VMV68_01495 [Spirochaetia bacterium]|nr:hypothetical protein [Spirochaetia bacterium]